MGYDPVKRLEEIESLTAKLKLTVTTEYHDALMHDWHTEVVELQEQLEKRIKDYVDLAIEVESLKLRLHVGGQRKKLLEAVYEAAKYSMSCNKYTHNGKRASALFGGVALLDALDAVQPTEQNDD